MHTHERIAGELRATASALEAVQASVARLPLATSPAAEALRRHGPAVAAALQVLAEVLGPEGEEVIDLAELASAPIERRACS
jgi:hypothetical protein